MNILDLFSAAAGGWSLGMHRAGFQTVAACENVDWRRALYQENNPNVLIYDDVCTLTADRLLRDIGFLPDVVVGSPPCQDISSANTKGKGVEGERSGLYFEAVRIIGEVRPRWFALENSANLITRGADAVLDALEALGYTVWAFVVGAGDVGANHERKRSWLIGCDIDQIADADGFGRDEGRSRRRSGINIPVPEDIGDAEEDGCGPRLSRGCVGAVAGPEQSACGDAWNSDRQFGATGIGTSADEGRNAFGSGRFRPDADDQRGDILSPAGDASHADQAGQADGYMVSGLQQEEIANNGRGFGRGDDRSVPGQMGIRETDRGDVAEWRTDWSLDDLAHHLRLDAGLSSWMADTRIAVGGPKGTSAASLIVEAFGDSVVPQIPEAIGRAIIRTESALRAVYGRAAA